MISIVNSSNYLLFPHFIAPNYNQNVMRKMFVFVITILITVSGSHKLIPKYLYEYVPPTYKEG